MAAPTETYIDPAVGGGSDHGGAAFVDGSFANATNTLTKIGAFTAATCQAGDKIYLTDNGSGEVTAGLYTIQTRTDDDNVVLTADIRSGAPDPTDVVTALHDGTINLEWATVQHALDFTTRDAANGDRFNVKAGTDDVLAAQLDFSTYGVPTAAAPFILQGYTAAAGDGGVGGISGGASVGIRSTAAPNYVHLIDMHLHNCAGNYIWYGSDGSFWINCEFDNCTTHGTLIKKYGAIINSYFHNIGDAGIYVAGEGVLIQGNTFENGADDFVAAIEPRSTSVAIIGNVIDIDGTSLGVDNYGAQTHIINNSIYSAGGTGTGIALDNTDDSGVCINNIIEGFSGAGGKGIAIGGSDDVWVLGHNAFYNNTTNLSQTAGYNVRYDLTANDINPTTASPFTDAANDDFTVTTEVQALGYPTANYPGLAVRSYNDIGALQRKSQMLVHPGMSGGARG